jgi:hypothetical protein
VNAPTIVTCAVFALAGYVLLDVLTEFGLTRQTWCRALGHRWDRPEHLFGKMCARCTYCPHLEYLEQRFGKLP